MSTPPTPLPAPLPPSPSALPSRGWCLHRLICRPLSVFNGPLYSAVGHLGVSFELSRPRCFHGMPDTRYLAVKYNDLALQDPQAEAQIYAQTARGAVLLDMQRYKEKFVIAYKDMQKMDASALIIRGGDYTLQPVPSPKFMRRFDKGTQEGDQDGSDPSHSSPEALNSEPAVSSEIVTSETVPPKTPSSTPQ